MQMIQRTLLALLTGCLLSYLMGVLLLPVLRRLKLGQNVRDDGPQSHLSKQGTPTMGGLMMLAAVVVATLIFSSGDYTLALPALLVSIAYTLVGFLDDFIKVRKHRSLGLRAYQKIIAQFGFALGASFWLRELVGTKLYLPISGTEWDLGLFYIPFSIFVIIAAVNAVNLTDGLDGLCASVTEIYTGAMALGLIMLVNIPERSGVFTNGVSMDGLAVFAGAVTGACLGFIGHNAHPAKVFMGDTGSFLLGGAVGMIALLSRCALLLPLMGFCFVASALSSIIQVGSYKLRNKKRVFKMAPLHHHFELSGMKETRIVAGYSIVTALLCIIGLLLITA